MSLNPHPLSPIPDDTARIAKTALRNDNRYLVLRDTFGELFTTSDFHDLYHPEGRPSIDPARLALVTLVQFAENLSDARAADAVRSRIDLKYLLALPLDDQGFDASVLSEFRTRLTTNDATLRLFEVLLEHFRSHKLLRERGRQRTDSTHVLAAVRALNRITCVRTSFRHALNALAAAAPVWLRQHADPAWLDRYAADFELTSSVPSSKQAQREALERELASDGLTLLKRALSQEAPLWLREIPAVGTLWRVWLQNFTGDSDGSLRFRANDEIPPGRIFLSSPLDTDARYGQKRTTSWVGYKVHLTETCDEELPLVITNVETTVAPLQDFDTTREVHEALDARDLLPGEHLVDTGYLSADLLLSEQHDHRVDLVGPARTDQDLLRS